MTTKYVAQEYDGTDTTELVHAYVHNDETDALDLKQFASQFIAHDSS